MAEVVCLSHEEINGVATTREYIDAVRSAYRERGNGAPTEPRTSLQNDDPAGLFNNYIAILPERGVMGGYTYSAGFGSADAWLVTPLFDAESGRPLGILDGSTINTYKTGAAGAVGIDALAREDASVLSVFGSGAQAFGQVRAAVAVRDFTEIRVYSPTQAHRESFAETLTTEFGRNAHAVNSPAEAVKTADVVVTATTASEPVFDADDLQPGTHINAVGQYHPEKREIESAVIRRSTYVPDLRERAFQDAGSFLLALEEGAITEDTIHGELGDVLVGTVPGRTNANEITVFDSGGTALETVASAAVAYENATERGLGSTMTFTPASEVYEGKKGTSADEL